MIAAVYLDSNISKTSIFFKRTIINNIDSLNKIIDYKGILISYFQIRKSYNFAFKTQYNNKLEYFISYININNIHLYGFGENKKTAEMNVSEIAVNSLKS